MRVYVCLCIYVYIYIYTNMHACVCVCVCACVYTFICVYMYGFGLFKFLMSITIELLCLIYSIAAHEECWIDNAREKWVSVSGRRERRESNLRSPDERSVWLLYAGSDTA